MSITGLWEILNVVDKGRGNILVIEIPQKDPNLKSAHMNDLKDTVIKNMVIFYFYLQSLLHLIYYICLVA